MDDISRSWTRSDSFVRWQTVTIQYMGTSSNVIPGITTGLLAFYWTYIVTKASSVYLYLSLAGASLCLLGSATVALLMAWNRLCDFRTTATIARVRQKGRAERSALRQISRQLGKRTWRLFYAQITLFGLGALFGFLTIIVSRVYGLLTALP